MCKNVYQVNMINPECLFHGGPYIRPCIIMRFLSVMIYDLNLQLAHICHFTIKTLVGAGVPLFKLIQRLLVIWKMAVEENRNVCQETIIRNRPITDTAGKSDLMCGYICSEVSVRYRVQSEKMSVSQKQFAGYSSCSEILRKLHCMFNALNTK